jgi:hypothetical protein
MSNVEHIKEYYRKLSAIWYIGIENYIQARIVIDIERKFNCDGYSHSENAIYLYHAENEIVVPEISNMLATVLGVVCPNETKWPEWKKLIAEEALHEYEYKIVHQHNKICDQARSLCELYTNFFYPPFKHRCDFFQAITEKADYFEESPESLSKILGCSQTELNIAS